MKKRKSKPKSDYAKAVARGRNLATKIIKAKVLERAHD